MPMPVINSLLLFIIYLFVLRQLFIYFVRCSTIYSFCCLISFLINFFVYSLFKREKNNSDPELCLGISISLFLLKYHHQYKSINIIQQTPPTLS